MSFNEWTIKTVEELVEEKILEKPIDGNHGGIHPSGDDFVNEGIPFIMASDIQNGVIDYSNCKFIKKEQADKLQKGFSVIGDVLLTHKATIGRTAIVQHTPTEYIVLTPQVTYYRVKDYAKLNNKFLKYYFDSSKFQELINSWASGGSTRAYIGITEQRRLPVPLPPIDIQNKIASIFSSIDDKIENNLATNQTLEEIARTLFKEWFVNFNYPNADGNLKHSEFGEIPESWSIGTLGDIYKTTSGGTPSRSKAEYYENGTIGWIKSKELNNSFIIDTEEKITEDALKNSSAKLLPKHSVLIAMYGATVGEIGVTTKEFTCNQAICSFLPNDNYPFSFIYNFLLHSKQDIIGRAVGSAQQNISQQVLLQFKLVIPPSELVQEYHRIVFPLFQKIQDNIEENESLRDLRDCLLPKLMSGEIEVKNGSYGKE